jgi:hypothetical protein
MPQKMITVAHRHICCIYKSLPIHCADTVVVHHLRARVETMIRKCLMVSGWAAAPVKWFRFSWPTSAKLFEEEEVTRVHAIRYHPRLPAAQGRTRDLKRIRLHGQFIIGNRVFWPSNWLVECCRNSSYLRIWRHAAGISDATLKMSATTEKSSTRSSCRTFPVIVVTLHANRMTKANDQMRRRCRFTAAGLELSNRPVVESPGPLVGRRDYDARHFKISGINVSTSVFSKASMSFRNICATTLSNIPCRENNWTMLSLICPLSRMCRPGIERTWFCLRNLLQQKIEAWKRCQ